MDNNIKEDLLRSISYENTAKSSYLILHTEAYENLLEYQIEMVNNNLHYGVLPIKSILRDEKLMLFYDITSKESLKTYLSKTKLNKNQTIKIITDITKSILDSKDILLYDNNFILDEEMIFIDLHTLKVNFVYIPIKVKGNINQDYKEFIVKLLSTSIRLDDNYEGFFIERILEYLKQDDFNLLDFLNRLNYYDGGNLNDESTNIRFNKSEDLISTKLNSESKHENKNNLTQQDYIKKKVYKPVNIVIAVVCQVLITVFLLITKDSLSSINKDPITTYLGLGLVIVAFNILLFKKLFNKDSMIEKTVTKAKSKKILPARNANICTSNYVSVGNDTPTAVLKQENTSPTEVLETDVQAIGEAFLKDINNGKIKNVQPVTTPYLIGRHIEYADYIINNKSVGRTHAEIIIKNDKYHIKDLDSKNGTKLNGMNLEPNKEYELKNEDIIVFADSKHIFTVVDNQNLDSHIITSKTSEEESNC